MVRHYVAVDTGIDESFGLHLGAHHFLKPSFELHSHDFTELVVILAGRGRHLTDYGDYELQAGDVFVISGDTAHGFADSSGMDIMNFMFTDWYLEQSGRWLRQLPGYHALFVLEPVHRNRHGLRNRLRLKQRDLRQARQLIKRIEDEYRSRRIGYRAAVNGLWQQILALLCRAFSDQDTADEPYSPLADTLAYMEEHFAEELSLDDLAHQAHVSANHFIRVFKQHYDCTPHRYLNQLRIEHARELLQSTDASMTEIARRCGFGDSNYFARQFRQHNGESPRAFRQRQRSDSGQERKA